MSAETDALSSLKKWIAAGVLFLFVGQLALAWNADAQRKHNCHLMEHALDAYTEGLVLASNSTDGPPDTPKEQTEFNKAFDALTSTYRPVFDECH